jgi:hypothetical protein
MEVQEVLLAEGLDRGLHPPDGRVLSAELSQACAHGQDQRQVHH